MSGRLSVVLANRLPEIGRLAGLVEAFGEEHALPFSMVFNLNTPMMTTATTRCS